jgi:hypothetical protein
VEVKFEEKGPEFSPARNDKLMNATIMDCLMGWQANCDFKPPIDPRKCKRYIAK